MKSKFILLLILFTSISNLFSQTYNVQFGLNNNYNLRAESGAVYNTAIGAYSMSNGVLATPNGVLDGDYNTAVGGQTLVNNTSGSDNCAFGIYALRDNLTGSGNVGIGREVLRSNTNSAYNVAIGHAALWLLNPTTIAAYNTAVGFYAGKKNVEGINNVFIGANAGVENLGTGNVFIGYSAGYNELESNKLYISNSSTSSPLIYGDFSTGNKYANINSKLGVNIPNNTLPNNNLEIYSQSNNASGLRFTRLLASSPTVASNGKVLTVDSNGDVVLTTDQDSGSGSGNFWSLTGNAGTTATTNFLGTTDDVDLVFKRKNLRGGFLGASNTAFGVESLNTTTGGSNCAFGRKALLNNTSGEYNVAIGFEALKSNTVSQSNVAIGGGALFSFTGTGTVGSNVAIGRNAGYNNASGKRNVFLGNSAGYDELGSDRLYIHNSASSEPLIYGRFDSRHVDINGKLGINLSSNSAPQNTLEIREGTSSNKSGLRFTDLTNSYSPSSTSSKFLTVDNNGDVILQNVESTYIDDGLNTEVTGLGTVASPFQIDAENIYTHDGTLTQNRLVNMDSHFLLFNTGGSTTSTGGRIYIGDTDQFTTTTGGNFVTFDDIEPENIRDYRLYVEGGILTERVKVALRSTANWSDYVFNKDYKLMPLSDVEAFVKENNHLPGIDSADNLVKNGLDVAEMQAKQMAKIEELTLYVIEQNKEIEELKAQVKALLERK